MASSYANEKNLSSSSVSEIIEIDDSIIVDSHSKSDIICLDGSDNLLTEKNYPENAIKHCRLRAEVDLTSELTRIRDYSDTCVTIPAENVYSKRKRIDEMQNLNKSKSPRLNFIDSANNNETVIIEDDNSLCIGDSESKNSKKGLKSSRVSEDSAIDLNRSDSSLDFCEQSVNASCSSNSHSNFRSPSNKFTPYKSLFNSSQATADLLSSAKMVSSPTKKKEKRSKKLKAEVKNFNDSECVFIGNASSSNEEISKFSSSSDSSGIYLSRQLSNFNKSAQNSHCDSKSSSSLSSPKKIKKVKKKKCKKENISSNDSECILIETNSIKSSSSSSSNSDSDCPKAENYLSLKVQSYQKKLARSNHCDSKKSKLYQDVVLIESDKASKGNNQDITIVIDDNELEQEKFDAQNVGKNIYLPAEQMNCTGLRPVIIDGSNVAFSHGLSSMGEKKFSCKGIEICTNYFNDRGHRVIVFVPLWRKTNQYTIQPEILVKLAEKGFITFTPSRRVNSKLSAPYDDRYIVQCATVLGGVIVSTDNYRDLLQENEAWRSTIENRLLMFTFIGDMLMFPQDPLGRHGPNLDEFLRFPDK